ncbi:ABC transporter substrate-binding protein [Ornithinibacillus sp. L9]|uniref:ABC transporter substrate-binding protein n=1 Tax=Ornithinibacillus caprae TaxID=2678566 RepID=A0A6N8FPZ2_9BACI|nr:iron-siderophore ABC transporter substrate-binding protein [Ornithinibacillus caprae]MUK90277.1 ABC transporter substrate-binding protein [Ornithinibacillus caprae]
MKKLISLLFMIALTLLVACGGNDTTEDDETNDTNTDQDRTVTIEDAIGEQTITGIPENIVVLEWSYAEHLLALGIQPAGVADLDGFHQWVNIDAEFDESVEDVGTRQEPNLEAISRLNPDLIIAVDFRHEQFLDSLGDIAPVVTFAPYGEEAIQDHYQNMIDEFQTVATIVDQEEEAESVLADLEQFLEDQKERVVEADLEGATYIATQAYSAQNTPVIRLFTDNSMVAQVMNNLGFENAYESDTVEVYGYSEVNVEALQNFQEENLQFLYIVQEDDNIFENQLKGNPVWENLSFVQEGNTHQLPGDTWTFGGTLSAKVLTETLVDAMVNE